MSAPNSLAWSRTCTDFQPLIRGPSGKPWTRRSRHEYGEQTGAAADTLDKEVFYSVAGTANAQKVMDASSGRDFVRGARRMLFALTRYSMNATHQLCRPGHSAHIM
jgi:hypothetical protein